MKRIFQTPIGISGLWENFGSGFVGVENANENAEMNSQSLSNPFSPFRPGPGKPTLRRDYLFSRRENLLCLIEPHWYELEWILKCARKPDQVHQAFHIEAFKLHPGHLMPLLRASCESVTRKDLATTRKRLVDAVQKAQNTAKKYQAQSQSHEEARRTSFALSEDFEEQLRGELERRRKYISRLKGWSEKVKNKIRGYELETKTRIKPTAARSAAIAALQNCMVRLERDQIADETVCFTLEARIRAITPEARKFAINDEALQKSRLDSSGADSRSADKALQAIETTMADREAFVYRTEILNFVRRREYALKPISLANAIAGMEYITARRSAQLCSKMKSKVARSTAYELFEFVTRVWNQRRKQMRAKVSLIKAFENAIRQLPKFEIIDRHKRPKWFRSHLADNWYHLKRALQEPELARLHPCAVPGAIVKHFYKNMQNPASPITPRLAEAKRIQD